MLYRFLLFSAMLITSGGSHGQPASKFNWMVGHWQIETARGRISENWVLRNDSTLSGTSYFTPPGKDSLLQEKISLEYRQGTWYYVPQVVGQNNNEPVSFALIFIGREEWIAENPAHDFPQRIAYRRLGDRLFASIEGRKGDQYRKQNFDFF